jgi:hypothetical protein
MLRSRHRALLAIAIAVLLALYGTTAFAEDLPSPPTEKKVEAVQESAPTSAESALMEAIYGPTVPNLVTIGLNFPASQYTVDSGYIPPDTMGAVGPDYIVEFINGRFDVYDKITGNQVDTAGLGGFWSNIVGLTIPDFGDDCVGGLCSVSGGACTTDNDCVNNFVYDPRIVYDPASGLWFATSLDATNPATGDNNIYVARSNTDDPRSIGAGGGGWQGYYFDADTVAPPEFHDYDTLAVDADGLYTCTQDFDSGSGGGGVESCYSIPKTDLLQSPPVATNMSRFESNPAGLPSVGGSVQPILDFGPSNGRTPLMGTNGGFLVRGNIIGTAALGTVVGITGDPGHAGPPAARQPAPGPTIENVAPRFVSNVIKQGDSLWAVHAVAGSLGNSAIRWYEIDEATDIVLQTGFIENLSQDFHEPSIAVNEFGHVVIGYTCSGPSLPASACASVGKTVGGVTTFEAPVVLYTESLAAPNQCYFQEFNDRNRWGDYSATVLDPVDICTFWTFQEYTSVGADCTVVGTKDGGGNWIEGGRWGIRVTELTFEPPVISTTGDVDLPDTCVGSTSTEVLEVCNTTPNTGPCANLVVDSIESSNPEFEVTAPSSDFPVLISPDFCFPFQVRFTPTSTGTKTTTLTVISNDPTNPAVDVQASGEASQQDIRVTGSGDFGSVCAGTLAEQTVSVCNVGGCNLDVTSVGFDPACSDFTLINNPFPAIVSPDSCLGLTVRFTPESDGPKTCNLVITSDDPDQPEITQVVTADTPEAVIDVSPDQGFPPTVIQSVGACSSEKPFTIQNNGICPLGIQDASISSNDAEYSLASLPSVPVEIDPGELFGEGDLRTVFAPDVLARTTEGEVSVTYVSDAVTGDTDTITRELCGEAVHTGARVLVTQDGVPVDEVKMIQLRRITANRNKQRLDTVDVARDLTLQTVPASGACDGFQYHREYGTVSNPIQLLPGSYEVTVQVRIGRKMKMKTVGFDVGTCDFNPTITVDF